MQHTVQQMYPSHLPHHRRSVDFLLQFRDCDPFNPPYDQKNRGLL
jgi:hypothetical protein